MTDDAFHLTALDVRRFDFPAALRGYDRARVDAFREQVAEEIERLTRQIADVDSRARGFHEQLKAFRERDKALNDALVSAQQLRGDIRGQAEKEAELIIREAKAEAEKILEGARAHAKNISAEMESLERSRMAFLSQLKALTERQLAEIDAAYSLATTGRSVQPGEGGEGAVGHPTPSWLKSLVEE